jgi:hypothetical protein
MAGEGEGEREGENQMTYTWQRAVAQDGEVGSMVFPKVLVQGGESDADLLMCQGLETLWALDPDTGACRWMVPVCSYDVKSVLSKFCAYGDGDAKVPACVAMIMSLSKDGIEDTVTEQLRDAHTGDIVCVRPVAQPGPPPAALAAVFPGPTAFDRQPMSDAARREVLAELSRRGTVPWTGANNCECGCGLLVVRTEAHTAVVFSTTAESDTGVICSVACVRELGVKPYWTPEPVDARRVLVVPSHRRHCEVTDVTTGISRVVALASDLTTSADSPQHLFPFHVLRAAGRRPPCVWLASYDSIVACVHL